MSAVETAQCLCAEVDAPVSSLCWRAVCVLCGCSWDDIDRRHKYLPDPWLDPRRAPAELVAAFRVGGLNAVLALALQHPNIGDAFLERLEGKPL